MRRLTLLWLFALLAEARGRRYESIKLLELEVVHRPVQPVAGEIATLRFRVKQLSDPDPQYVPPPVRVRRFSLAGAQLEQRWMQPDGAGIYEAAVPMREATRHYLYFDTDGRSAVLKKVPWVVLKSAE